MPAFRLGIGIFMKGLSIRNVCCSKLVCCSRHPLCAYSPLVVQKVAQARSTRMGAVVALLFQADANSWARGRTWHLAGIGHNH